MRKSPEASNVLSLPSQRLASFARRPIAPINGHLTCLVLVKHLETHKALLVSDDGDPVGAVWLPKALLLLDPGTQEGFLVATMSQSFANQKRLYPRFIDRARFLPPQVEALERAESLAARNRNRLRNFREPLPYPGRNAFA